MSCSRCGSNCNCFCSGDPLPAHEWRRQVALQVREHKVRKRRRLDPEAPLLAFDEQDPVIIEETSTAALRTSAREWDESAGTTVRASAYDSEMIQPTTCSEETAQRFRDSEPQLLPQPQMLQTSDSLAAVISERPPLAPFPRLATPIPKIIEFPRLQIRQYELAEPVADQLRIFEAVEDPAPRPQSHLSEIEIAPEQPAYFAFEDIEVPIQAAALEQRAYAAALDGAVMIGAMALFAVCAESFATSLPMTKPLLESSAVCVFLLLTVYYLLSFSLGRSTAGMEASGLRVITFSGDAPSRMILRCRALATVLSYTALGMGLAWSLIDEDRLCWHDRITHTYLISK